MAVIITNIIHLILVKTTALSLFMFFVIAIITVINKAVDSEAILILHRFFSEKKEEWKRGCCELSFLRFMLSGITKKQKQKQNKKTFP